MHCYSTIATTTISTCDFRVVTNFKIFVWVVRNFGRSYIVKCVLDLLSSYPLQATAAKRKWTVNDYCLIWSLKKNTLVILFDFILTMSALALNYQVKLIYLLSVSKQFYIGKHLCLGCECKVFGFNCEILSKLLKLHQRPCSLCTPLNALRYKEQEFTHTAYFTSVQISGKYAIYFMVYMSAITA